MVAAAIAVKEALGEREGGEGRTGGTIQSAPAWSNEFYKIAFIHSNPSSIKDRTSSFFILHFHLSSTNSTNSDGREPVLTAKQPPGRALFRALPGICSCWFLRKRGKPNRVLGG
mmetsp:Transcript_21273/g.50574  ORF Transcript_21273/g.50574 Transcript_21273/m.50574 type:complete len:114 (-) Transcript_21273:41-382(-)